MIRILSHLRGPWLLLAFLCVVLLTGAVLAPLLAWAGDWYVGLVKSFRLQSTPLLGWLGEKIAGSDFPRFFNRAFLVAALVWLVPFAKAAGVTRRDLGLEQNRYRFMDATVGFILASGLLLLLGAILMRWGRFVNNPKADAGSILVTAGIACVAVALLEEFFFRGALMGFLLRTMRRFTAVVFLAAFFAVLHLLNPPVHATVPHPSAGSGFYLVGEILGRFGDLRFFLAEFCTLFVVGLLLGWARMRTQSLWLSIGLHAGLVFALKLFSGMTRSPKKVSLEQFQPWIGVDLKNGVAPLLTLLLMGGCLWVWFTLRDKALAASNK